MTIYIPTWINGILQPVEKLAAHQRGLRHKAVSVFLLRDGDVLLQRRALSKYHTPGLWANTCCTHPMWEESGLDCALRRLDEELGITGVELEYRDTVEYRADVGEGLIEHEVVDIFVGEMPRDAPLDMNPDEVMETRWTPLATLNDEVAAKPDEFTPWLRIYLDQYAELIFDGRGQAE
ncbi:isopentenyl-diphosphate Delta-isomerase [Gymnodinialimonas ceratoperidinii]|uniref:Isopentenyl-diphosphate Delta-isomerase n=1 Tax=Gymnodinialimonas ceratoperidinii TaxID=2856823 RepID=A0A8F6TW18_9RHOB|nr:isopentenyl-diphosphate Delta-isomerase [Gymnodinialimonas ceratoperidinii]QXT39986.1 isopentenyl-diphosphate Delta-isomerase [Gymnodinialimonas ceratoperidinii]